MSVKPTSELIQVFIDYASILQVSPKEVDEQHMLYTKDRYDQTAF